ncbi:MAG: tRNA lysidine(34) synthetase TilS [Arenicellales bacterium]|nr:tRNA lysidine(34) synthetase TilS [Arenicellales bacterium]
MNDVDRFNKQYLEQKLFTELGLQPDSSLYVAFSGGLDSTVLLHALISIETIDRSRITALHVNHGLHKQATAWEKECERRCQAWGVRFLVHHLDLSAASPTSIESAARQGRYRWFEQQLTAKDILLVAHHLDDQVETVLANLFRGAGSHGLKGMLATRALGVGQLWRPMIEVERSALHDYAKDNGLHWIHDPANEDQRHTRNYLRHTVLPLVRKTWPGITQTVSRAAQNWRDTALLLDEIAQMDLADVRHKKQLSFFKISVDDLNKLSELRVLNALRFWFRKCGFQAPARSHLQQLYTSMVVTLPKATAILSWPGVQVRRYRDWLYISSSSSDHRAFQISWNADGTALPGNRRLIARPVVGRGIKKDIYDTCSISIRSRVGGERCWLPNRKNHRKLKKLFQQSGVPPWERARVPLVYVEDELVAVVGFWYCQPFNAQDGEPGMEFILIDLDQEQNFNN